MRYILKLIELILVLSVIYLWIMPPIDTRIKKAVETHAKK